MITDAQLRSALEEMAGRAPDAERVRDGLAARARAHRQRRALLLVGGAAAVAAAGGAVGLGVLRDKRSTGPGDGPPTPNLPSPSPGPLAGNGNMLVPMHHRPTWLPEGVFEHQRGANTLGNRLIQTRIWRTQDPGAVTPHVQLFVMPDQELGTGEPVLVNGKRGLIATDGPTTALVAWPLAPGFSLGVVVGGMERSADIALRVARSVVPDNVSTLEVALDLGWLPDRVRGDHSVLLERHRSGVDRQVQISSESYTPVLLLFLSREEQARLDGEPIGLRGRTGRVGSGWAQVELDDGRLLGLSLTGVDSLEPTVGELRRIVDEVRIGPEPYTGWVGQR